MSGPRGLLKRAYFGITGSIAFLPGVIAIAFGLLAGGMMLLDERLDGVRIREVAPFLGFENASTAETILGALVGGILSLLVFSFSMVMIVLGRAASNLSPKILDHLTSQRSIQRVLGVYTGTVLYSLAMLVWLQGRPIERQPMSGLGIIVGILLGVLCVVLFVLFIHEIAETIKPRTLIARIARETEACLDARSASGAWSDARNDEALQTVLEWTTIGASQSGYLQQVTSDACAVAAEVDGIVVFERGPGEFVLAGSPLYRVACAAERRAEFERGVEQAIVLFDGEPIASHWIYGFRQLAEIAVKALSPGINDPGTALLCIDRVGQLVLKLEETGARSWLLDANGIPRVRTFDHRVEQVLRSTLAPIRHYGREDARVLGGLLHMLGQIASVPGKRASLAASLRAEAEAIADEARRSVTHPRDLEGIEVELDLLRRLGVLR